MRTQPAKEELHRNLIEHVSLALAAARTAEDQMLVYLLEMAQLQAMDARGIKKSPDTTFASCEPAHSEICRS